MKKKLLMAVSILSLLLSGCGLSKSAKSPDIVYIKEYDSYVQYYRMPEDYDGKTLYLRVEPLEEKRCYKAVNVVGSCGGYYPESDLDAYLREEFPKRFSKEMLDLIQSSSITVLTRNSVWEHGFSSQCEQISRKFFVLSASEIGIRSATVRKEGSAIAGISAIEKGEVQWLRSAYPEDDIHAFVWGEREAGGESVAALFAVRPAFTLPKTVKAVLTDDIVEGKEVYVIK